MKNLALKGLLICAVFALTFSLLRLTRAADTGTGVAATVDESSPDKSDAAAPSTDTKAADKANNKEEAPTETAPATKGAAKTGNRVDRADAFVAGPDWEFDGFVAGGQDSNVRSMFYLNDLIYVNIGSQHGIGTGDKIGIYKRGDRVRDPQTGRFLGYEVRRAAYARATDRVEDETAALRITNTYEAVEIGDLIRREQ